MGGAILRALAAILALAGPVRADGRVDSWILALSWSPAWCAADAERADAEQCVDGRRFIVHGLWPQRGGDGPAWCETDRPDPGRRQTRAMADLMGSAGLARHAWRKHGRCAGLSADDYFDLTRRAAAALRPPAAYGATDRDMRISAAEIERSFLDANPEWSADQITIVCKASVFEEVRACFTADLSPMRCSVQEKLACTEKGLHVYAPNRN